jgi:hypothetical protein
MDDGVSMDEVSLRVLRPLPPKVVAKIYAMNSPKSSALHRVRVIFLVWHALGHVLRALQRTLF